MQALRAAMSNPGSPANNKKAEPQLRLRPCFHCPSLPLSARRQLDMSFIVQADR